MQVKAVVVLYKFECKGKARAAKVVFLCGSIFLLWGTLFLLFRWRIAELLPENSRKMRQVFESCFKTRVGYFLTIVADFVVRNFQPFLYYPFLRRQGAYFLEVALEDGVFLHLLLLFAGKHIKFYC